MTAAKSPTERVALLRQRRLAAGLVRVDLYAHPEDASALRDLASRLAAARMAATAPKCTEGSEQNSVQCGAKGRVHPNPLPPGGGFGEPSEGDC